MFWRSACRFRIFACFPAIASTCHRPKWPNPSLVSALKTHPRSLMPWPGASALGLISAMARVVWSSRANATRRHISGRRIQLHTSVGRNVCLGRCLRPRSSWPPTTSKHPSGNAPQHPWPSRRWRPASHSTKGPSPTERPSPAKAGLGESNTSLWGMLSWMILVTGLIVHEMKLLCGWNRRDKPNAAAEPHLSFGPLALPDHAGNASPLLALPTRSRPLSTSSPTVLAG